ALVYSALGERGKALALYERALRLYQESLGKKHPRCAEPLNNMAALYRARGEHGKALSLYQQALWLNRESLGVKHPRYASTLGNLALLHHDLRQSAAAVVLSGQGLAIKLEHLQDTLGAVDDRQRVVLLEQASASLSLFLSLAADSELSPA